MSDCLPRRCPARPAFAIAPGAAAAPARIIPMPMRPAAPASPRLLPAAALAAAPCASNCAAAPGLFGNMIDASAADSGTPTPAYDTAPVGMLRSAPPIDAPAYSAVVIHDDAPDRKMPAMSPTAPAASPLSSFIAAPQ